MHIFFKKLIILLLLTIFSFASITGVAFKDYNSDGIKQDGEPGISGINLKVYTSDTDGDKLIAEVNTTTDGSYTVDIDSSDFPVRLEFDIPKDQCFLDSTLDFSSAGGDNYGTSIQVAQEDEEVHNFAVSYPYDVATDDNPETFTAIEIAGDPLGGGTTADTASILKFNYKDNKIAENSGRVLEENSTQRNRTAEETGPAWTELTKQSQTGSIYGISFSRQAQKVFASAFLKRHTGLGPLGSGGIYIIDPDPTKNTDDSVQFLNLDEIGIATSGSGTYSDYVVNGEDDNNTNDFVYFSTVIGSNSEDRKLDKDKNISSNDPAAYGQVGKLSLGDIDISEDGRYLYVVNLYDRKLYQIDLTDPENPIAPTAENKDEKVKSFEIPDTCQYSTKAGEYRPFGLKVIRDKAYVGIVCSGQDDEGNTVADSTSDMKGTVYALDLTTQEWASEPEIEWFFDYRDSDGSDRPWHPWTNQWRDEPEYGIPIIGDIEFDNNGDILIGIIDMQSHKKGYGNYGLTLTNLFHSDSTGDLIQADRVLSNNSKCEYTTDLANEFYDDNLIHPESSIGSLAGHHTSNEDSVLSTFIDPTVFSYEDGDVPKPFSAGVHLYDNKTGKRVHGDIGYEIVYHSLSIFGKANAIGDLETMEIVPPIEIGNLIWRDFDNDGIQDPDEPGIANVNVELLDADGNLIATTTTDERGYYIFNSSNVNDGQGLIQDSNYTVRIDLKQFSGAGLDDTVLENLFLTKTDSTSTSSEYSDRVDSDAVIENNYAVINLTTGAPGENNHTYDIGLYNISLSLIKKALLNDANGDGTANLGESITYTFIVTNTGDVPLNDINITDAKVGSITCEKTTLEANESTNCSADNDYIISQEDVDNGYVKNSAIVEGTAPDGKTVNDVSDTGTDANGSDIEDPEDTDSPDENGSTDGDPTNDPTIIDISQNPSIAIIKKGYFQDENQNGVADVGETIKYVFIVKNTGDVTLYDIQVNDSLVMVEGGPITLASGEEDSSSFTATYTLTESDIEKQEVVNQAIASGKDPSGNVVTDKSDDSSMTEGEDDPTITKFISSISIGNYVWFDENLNGIQDEGPGYGVSGIKVSLYDSDGNIAKDVYGNEVQPVVTDSSGYYQFTDLSQNEDYYIKFEIPEGYNATLQDQDSDLKDSDANSEGLIYVNHPTEDNMSFDMGIYCDCEDWRVNPEKYQEVEADSFNNITIILFFTIILILSSFVRVENK